MAKGLTFNIFGHDVSASKAIRGVEGTAERSTARMGEHFKHLGRVIVGAFAAEKILEFGKQAFEAAESAEKVTRQTEAVLKSTDEASGETAKGIADLSHTIGGYSGMTDAAVQSGENMLLTFQNVRNEVGKGNDIFTQASKTATDLSVALHTPLRNAMKLVGKAVNDPIKGLTALARVGVTFTDGQKQQIKTMVATGHTMQAQKLILAQLNEKFAGSAAAQATPADKAKAAWGNLKVELGEKLLPVVNKVATFLTDHVIPAISTVAAWVKKNTDWLVPLAAAITAIVVVVKAWAVAQAILDAALAANPIVLIAAAIAALGVALVIAYKKSETFRNIVKDVFDVLKVAARVWWAITKAVFDAFKAAFNVVKAVVVAVAAAIGTAWHGMSTALHVAWDGIKTVFGWIKDGIRAVKTVVHDVAHGFRAAIRPIVSAFEWVWNKIKKIVGWIMGAVHGITDAVNSMISSVKSALGLGGQGTVGGPNFGSSSTGTFGGTEKNNPALRASGGPVFAGVPYIVGERRPELFVPNQSGYIQPRVGMDNGTRKTVNNYITIVQSNVVQKSSATATPEAMRAASNALGKI